MHMEQSPSYININRQAWNNKTAAHLQSSFYDMDGFRAGKSSLKSIELELLGNINGKTLLHLQCHFGQDTISLSRMGAKVTGVDLSDKAIETARALAGELQSDARFICCDVYEVLHHHQLYDIVFTSYGTIGWLPDLTRWAQVISASLHSGGKFIMAEFHPVVWMFDNQFKDIGYNYFNTGAIEETEQGTYADRNAAIEQQYICWNHSLSEVIQSLLDAGLRIEHFGELDYSPYNCFEGTEEFEPGKFRIKHLGNKIPMLFTIIATKP